MTDTISADFDPAALSLEITEREAFGRELDALLSRVTLREAVTALPYKSRPCSRCKASLPAGLPRAGLRLASGRKRWSVYLCAWCAEAAPVEFRPLDAARAWRAVRRAVLAVKRPDELSASVRAFCADVLVGGAL